MSTQRYISTSFWTDRWIRTLDPSERYLYLYLMTNPQTNIAGVYQITLDRMAFDTGYDERTIQPMLQRFADAGKAVFYHDEWVIIPTWVKHQKVKERSKVKIGIENIVKKLPQDVREFLPETGYPIDTLSIGDAYDTNYLDSNLDLDSNSDSDAGDGLLDRMNAIHSRLFKVDVPTKDQVNARELARLFSDESITHELRKAAGVESRRVSAIHYVASYMLKPDYKEPFPVMKETPSPIEQARREMH